MRTGLFFVGGLALLLRLAAFFAAERPEQLFQSPDSVEYDRLAWNLADHGVYSLEKSAPWTPDLTRTPVYPLFVAACYRLLGHRPALAVLIQIVCAVGTVLVVCSVGTRLLPTPAALGAAGFLALDPLSIHYAILLLSETLFTLVFFGSLFCLLAYLRSPAWGWVIVAAFLTALAILCRPIAVLWPLAMFPGVVVLAWRQRSWRPFTHYGVFLAGVAVAVGPWIIRNQRVGGLAVLTTVQGINLYYHRAAILLAEQQGVTVSEARAELAKQLRQVVEREHLTPAQAYRLMESRAEEIIASMPGRYIGAHADGLMDMFMPEPLRDSLPRFRQLGIYWVEAALLTVVYGLALIGLIDGLRRRERFQFLLLGASLVYFVLLSGPEAYARFRVPIMPIIAVLAGAGLVAALTGLQKVVNLQPFAATRGAGR